MHTLPASYWPRHLPRHLEVPFTTIGQNLEISARRFPRHAAIHSFGSGMSYTQLLDEVERFAGWLTRRTGVKRGDRVMLNLQNSAQWIIAYYGTLRADAVVVPVNPMNRSAELAYYLGDSGACVAVCAQDLVGQLETAAAGTALRQIIVATYSDYIQQPHDYVLPDWLCGPRQAACAHAVWADVMAANERPGPALAEPDDVCVLPYTSGSTGVPRACIHTHRTFMHNTAGLALWHWTALGTAFLCLAPLYHGGGLADSGDLPIFVGGTLVILPRWDRELALRLISREKIGHAAIPPTAVIDLLAHPDLAQYDLTCLRRIASGGAAMPGEVCKKLKETLGLDFIEGYGLTETAATTHNNPIDRPKRECLGVPFFDTESLVVDPVSLTPLLPGEQGEILVSGPQLCKGYLNRPDETAAAFVEVNGRRYLRTGDIGRTDEEGYFFMTDRAKRMINASGYKVWPAEVESVLYQHPGVKEVCVIGTHDAYRGETVKALVIPHAAVRDTLTAEALIAWSRERMAAYKHPRIVEFTDQLPKSPAGKILWRELQEAENAASG